ncbi:MAG: SGNH/GDSL hydrolase family protein [Candidatus Hydrogenedentota bacterium]
MSIFSSRKTFYKLLFIILSLSLSFVFLEAGIRLILPSQRHPVLYQKSESGSHLLKPNVKLKYSQKEFSHDIFTNSAGFRNKKELFNENIILFIGDSFTFGAGVDEENHYSYIFDRLLNWNKERFNVYNAGVPGYCTIDEYLYIKDLINRRLDIKVIILGVDISDFNENLLVPIYDIMDGRLVFSTKEKKGIIVRVINFLATNSELVNFIYYRIVHSSVLKNYFDSILNYEYFSINLPDKNLGLFARQKDQTSSRKLKVFEEYLIKIIELCREHDIELYVYYIPMILEIYDESYQSTLKTYDLKPGDFDLSFLNEYIKSIAIENNVQFLDLKSDLLRFNDYPLYFLIDQHFNKYGNFIAGISLYKNYLNKQK